MSRLVPALLAVVVGAGMLFGAYLFVLLTVLMGPADGALFVLTVLGSVVVVTVAIRAAARRSLS